MKRDIFKEQMTASDTAVRADGQHTSPCGDCPWRRRAIPGWLGSMTREEWLQCAHGEAEIECHVAHGAQCAGAAIYRANVCKTPRSRTILRLPADREKVFATPTEFSEHHSPEQRANWIEEKSSE